MKIIISALHFAWDDINQCMRRVKDEFSLDGIELSLNDDFNKQDLDAIRSLRAEMDIALYMHIWDDLAQLGMSQGTKVLLDYLEICKKAGIKGLVIHGGTYPERKEGITRTRRILESTLGQFEQAGVVLFLENHYAYDYKNSMELFSEPWEFKEVFSLDSTSLKFCFDTGHANMTGNSEALIRELGPWLHYIHLADNHGIDDDHAMFRKGTVDWHKIFDILQNINFDGVFCVEFPVRENTNPFFDCVHEIRKRWM